MYLLLQFCVFFNYVYFVGTQDLNQVHHDFVNDVVGQVKVALEERYHSECSIATIGLKNNSFISPTFIQTRFHVINLNNQFLSGLSDIGRHSSNLCSIIIYYSSELAATASKSLSRTKLSLSIAKRSYHIVICKPSTNSTEDVCRDIFHDFTQRGSILPELFSRHLFLEPSRMLHCYKMDPGNTVLLSEWDLLASDRINFQGRHLIWGRSRGGFSTGRKSSGTRRKKFDTNIPSLHGEVAVKFNATPLLRIVNKGGYGTKHPPPIGWTGLVGAVVRGKVHLTSFMTMTQDRGTDTLPTVTSFPDGVVFVTGLPQLKIQDNPLEFIFTAFDIYSWGALLSCLLLLAILISGYGGLNIVLTIAQLLSPTLEQNMSRRFLRRIKSSIGLPICISMWMVSVIFLSVELKTELISSITHPSHTHPPKTFAELVDSSYSILFYAKNQSGAGEIFSKEDNDLVKKLTPKIVGYYDLANDSCLRATQKPGIQLVCMGGRHILSGAANRMLKTKGGEPLYKISESMVTLFTAGFVSKRMGHISEKLNNILLQYLESGANKFEKIMRKPPPKTNGSTTKNETGTKNATRKNDEFSNIQHGGGIHGFLSLLIFTLYVGCFAFCVLLLEIWQCHLTSKFCDLIRRR